MKTIYARAMVTLALAIVFILGILYARAEDPTKLEGYSAFVRECQYMCPRLTDKCMARCIKRLNKRSKDERYW
jgi:hypothetical protein